MSKNDIVAPDGTSLRIIASAGDVSQRENLPEASNEIRISYASWFNKKYACGHRGPRRFELFVYGDTVRPNNDMGKCPDCCIEEIQKTVIHCALCELPIFPHAGVCLVHPTTPGVNLAIANFVDPEAVVCCMRWDCCLYPGLFAGHWTKEGFKQYEFEK